MALSLLALAMYISCIFHVVCASFSALATQKLANAKAVLSGIWALVLHKRKTFLRKPLPGPTILAKFWWNTGMTDWDFKVFLLYVVLSIYHIFGLA